MIPAADGGRRPGSPWARGSVAAHVVNLVVLAVMVVAVSLRDGQGDPHYPGTPLAVFTALQWLPLVGRPRWPVPALVLTVAASALQLLLLPSLDAGWDTAEPMAAFQPIPVAVAVAAYTVAVGRSRRTGWVAGTAAAVLLPALALLTSSLDLAWTALVMCNLVLDGTVAGVLVAGRRERIVREAAEQADRIRREVEAERLRIARELHDVLGHHLALVDAQASVAEYLVATDPAAAARALSGMGNHTRQALDELRATVGLLRTPAPVDAPVDADADELRSPLPTLDRLGELVDDVRAAGTSVELRVTGAPAPLAPGTDLTAYRVVQEALTNATKHAPGEEVAVDLEWAADRLRLTVRNPVRRAVGPARHPGHHLRREGGGGGHGLLGMAERVRAASGTLRIDRPQGGSDGAFTVTACLPAEPARETRTQEDA